MRAMNQEIVKHLNGKVYVQIGLFMSRCPPYWQNFVSYLNDIDAPADKFGSVRLNAINHHLKPFKGKFYSSKNKKNSHLIVDVLGWEDNVEVMMFPNEKYYNLFLLKFLSYPNRYEYVKF